MSVKKMNKQIVCLVFWGIFLLSFASAFEFKGEKIIYAISPLGTAEYNDEGLVELEGKTVKLITFRTRVTGFSDLEKIYAEPETLLPLKVERFIAYPIGSEYILEEYSPLQNALVIRKFANEKSDKIIKEYDYKAGGPIHNAITLPFYLRTLRDLDIGWSITARFPDRFQITLESIDDVEVPAGKFKAYHFTSTPQRFEIWISQDEYRIPIKIKGLGGYSYTMLMKEHYLEGKK